MVMQSELSALLIMGLAIYVWVWAGRGRETADRISDRVCREVDVQRLDQSLTLRRIRPGPKGRRFVIQRVYSFEYSTTGADRCHAEVALENSAPLWARLDHPNGALHIALS